MELRRYLALFHDHVAATQASHCIDLAGVRPRELLLCQRQEQS